MTIRRYLENSALTGEVTVTSVITGEKVIIRTSETWFHPQGGGQRGDRGKIGDAQVLDTRFSADGQIDHIVSDAGRIQPGMKLPFTIDEEQRMINMRMHSAGHLIAGVVEASFPGLIAVSGHHWPGEGRVEFREEKQTDITQAEVARLVGKAIEADLKVAISGDPYTNRVCSIENYRPIPCGGTHVSSTSEIFDIEIKGIKRKKGKLRIGYDILGC
ncbi:alanyl-tRNA editing protein [Modicisalibacter coralii]|uniref:alanyl-tRNA editing protein n=1 Tax=Modicisalibacter coralii TaxID=2304602 RepID=UPI00100C185A|nr:alanyl-tRNA editing protein [Halomonas coralii]